MATETENVGLSAFTESFFFASEFTCTLKHDKTTYIKWTLKNCQDQAVALAIQLCPSLSRKISHLFLLSQSSPGMVDNNTSSSYSASDDNLPKIDLFGGGNVDLRTVAPLYGVASEEEPDYLDYDIKGRGTVERMFLYSGSSYLTGILTGGILGGRTGWKTAPSPRFWLRLNSVMNGAGKLGSKWGNNAGVFALMYSLSESLLDHFETDKVLGGHQAVNPVLSGAISGLLYKSTAAPRTAALASVLGGFGAGMFYVIRGQLDHFYYR
jgi:import inner membrane translocase subunit TIM23